ncbi:MAG TPA: tetratricopeptide repeat protein, partial [Rubrobacteraceae bacterium]
MAPSPKNPSGSSRSPREPSINVPSAPPVAQRLVGLDPAGLAPLSLQAQLDQARRDYAAGRYANAERTLRDLIANLELWLLSATKDYSEYRFHLAAAHTLLGRTLARLNRDEESANAFDRAIDLFEKWLPRTREPAGQQLNHYGLALQRRGRHEQAQAVLQRAVEAGAGDAETHRYLGRALDDSGDHQKAEVHFRRALELDPDDPWAYRDLAKAVELQGRVDESVTILVSGAFREGLDPEVRLELLNLARVMQTDNLVVMLARVELLMRVGRPDEASAALDEALTLHHHDDDPMLQAALAEMLWAQGRNEEAVEVADRSLLLKPENAIALAVKGAALSSLGRNDEALQALDAALAVDPAYVFVLWVKGDVLRMQGRYEEALQSLDAALALNPQEGLALGVKGQTLAALGQNEEAVEVLRRAIELKPTWADLHSHLNVALFVLARHAEALEEVEWILADAPEDTAALRRKAYSLLALGHMDEATVTLRAALEIEPEDAVLLADMSYTVLRRDDYDGAKEFLDRAVALDGDNSWVLAVQGCYLCTVAEYGAGFDVLERATKADPTNSWSFGLKGWALCELAQEAFLEGKRTPHAEKAEQAYRQAAALDPAELIWRPGLADALLFQGRTDEATEQYRWVVEELRRSIDSAGATELSAAGWCHYRLHEYPDAVRLFVSAFSLDPQVATRFNLALVTAVNQQYELALGEYRSGIEDVRKKPPLGRRGPLKTAIDDLREAMKIGIPG